MRGRTAASFCMGNITQISNTYMLRGYSNSLFPLRYYSKSLYTCYSPTVIRSRYRTHMRGIGPYGAFVDRVLIGRRGSHWAAILRATPVRRNCSRCAGSRHRPFAPEWCHLYRHGTAIPAKCPTCPAAKCRSARPAASRWLENRTSVHHSEPGGGRASDF